jgi:hypothetical protein
MLCLDHNPRTPSNYRQTLRALDITRRGSRGRRLLLFANLAGIAPREQRQAALHDVDRHVDLARVDSEARHEPDRVLARGEQEHAALAREPDELRWQRAVAEHEPANEPAAAHAGNQPREVLREALQPRRQMRRALCDVRGERARGQPREDVVAERACERRAPKCGAVRAWGKQ